MTSYLKKITFYLFFITDKLLIRYLSLKNIVINRFKIIGIIVKNFINFK